jgi:predicted DsbA family dithiol-disulfide isomerase
MKITLYRSNLCPRCFLARKYLLEIVGDGSDVQIEEVDILGSPQRCLKDGIRMVPALVIDRDKLSGVFLSKKAIQSFITRHTA